MQNNLTRINGNFRIQWWIWSNDFKWQLFREVLFLDKIAYKLKHGSRTIVARHVAGSLERSPNIKFISKIQNKEKTFLINAFMVVKRVF